MVCEYMPYVCSYLQESEEAVWTPGAGEMGSCESSEVAAWNWVGIFSKQQVPVTTRQSLLPRKH